MEAAHGLLFFRSTNNSEGGNGKGSTWGFKEQLKPEAEQVKHIVCSTSRDCCRRRAGSGDEVCVSSLSFSYASRYRCVSLRLSSLTHNLPTPQGNHY